MDKKRSGNGGGSGAAGKRQRLIDGRRPSRFVFFAAGIWKDFPVEISAALCEAYRAGREIAEIFFASCHLAVFFAHMIQLNTGTGYRNSIGWFDSDGEFSSPIQPFEGPGSVDDVEKLLGGGKASLSARQGSSISTTDTDAACSAVEDEGGEVEDVTSSRSKLANLVVSSGGRLAKLEAGDPKLVDVKAAFLAGLGRLSVVADVTSVCKVRYDCPGGQARREAFETLSDLTAKVRGGDANLQQAWYGCSRNELLSVIKHGFGRPSVDSTYGVGIYLSPESLSRLSCRGADIDENGEQHVLLCRAILGKAELVRAGSKQFHPSSDLVDTGVDNLANPKRFIVWSTRMNTHILPLYVASFKFPRKWHGIMEASAKCSNSSEIKEKVIAPKQSSVTVPMLFSVLKPELSSSEMNIVVQDYLELKNAKISREEFLKRVRTLIGDEKLKKIQEQVFRSSVLCGFLICQSQNKLAEHQAHSGAKIHI
ncbi:probable inactive poly [ADP-ribose] polymerase SRO2 isoform X1 [Selaginella moellendorffii]|uniref:probable inactive poly [ADP-ribose] polymerase SRO2 isoform X1 n=1 Tax=Selaginella moellendorffii TaxID=88036 RepID=UPI000D1CCFEA|nr:probable inactive poly [ADP-ribose] polymerase SRO2 isoform X1 [Selaginella moellendorffii]|eukprot:XP_024517743.1 probable inactive poly [ADP-ribose] polymerase SRO2 isoform X1 [Selaginella moellendorffii]